MATGRIGVTPTLGTRWSKTFSGVSTSVSGLDDNSVALVYSVGYEQVYRNGVLLSRGNDYTATTGNSITLIDATIAGDIIEVFANELVPLTDAISKGQFTAKGALLSATAASTPGVLAVGTNGQYLTANSSTSTGLEWSTLSAGGMTLLSTTTLSGATTTISSISQDYNQLYIFMFGATTVSDGAYRIAPNSTTNIAQSAVIQMDEGGTTNDQRGNEYVRLNASNVAAASAENCFALTIYNYASTTSRKVISGVSAYGTTAGFKSATIFTGLRTTSAISSLQFSSTGGNLSSGTVLLYGVK